MTLSTGHYRVDTIGWTPSAGHYQLDTSPRIFLWKSLDWRRMMMMIMRMRKRYEVRSAVQFQEDSSPGRHSIGHYTAVQYTASRH